jgi:hypothetical protein
MENKDVTMPEDALLKSLDKLEELIRGVVPAEEEPELEKAFGKDDPEKDDDEDDDKKPDSDDDDDKEEDEDDDKVEKSFSESAAESSDNIQKAIEVSDFLSDLVGLVGEAIDGLKEATEARFEQIEKSLAKSCEIQETTNLAIVETLKKSFQAVSEKTDIQAEDLVKSIKNLNDELSKAPAGLPKSKTHILEKSFGDDGEKTMSKSEIMKSLRDLYDKGDAGVTSMDIVKFEGSGILSPHIRKMLAATK